MKLAALLLATLALAGCSSTVVPQPEPTTGDLALPTTGTIDYQLGGSYDPPAGTTIVARDRTEKPADGVFTICYVNGFQSQGHENDFWLDEHPELVLRGNDGEPVFDPNWPDEFLFDTSTESNRAALSDVIGEWIDGCAVDGFSAVEFDNLDSFTRSDGALTEDDNVQFAAILVSRAHENFLPAGQKNSAELGSRGPEIGFDFAVAEECHRWNECDLYTDVYGEHVIDIEYFDDLRGTVEEICADAKQPPLTVIRDRGLTTPGDPAYQYEVCSS